MSECVSIGYRVPGPLKTWPPQVHLSKAPHLRRAFQELLTRICGIIISGRASNRTSRIPFGAGRELWLARILDNIGGGEVGGVGVLCLNFRWLPQRWRTSLSLIICPSFRTTHIAEFSCVVLGTPEYAPSSRDKIGGVPSNPS